MFIGNHQTFFAALNTDFLPPFLCRAVRITTNENKSHPKHSTFYKLTTKSSVNKFIHGERKHSLFTGLFTCDNSQSVDSRSQMDTGVYFRGKTSGVRQPS